MSDEPPVDLPSANPNPLAELSIDQLKVKVLAGGLTVAEYYVELDRRGVSHA